MKKNIWSIIGVVVILFLAFYFFSSILSDRNTYKKEISVLNEEKKALLSELNNKVNKDTLFYYANQKHFTDSIIENLNNKLKEMQNEKINTNFHIIPIDSNIVAFTKFLSTETNNK